MMQMGQNNVIRNSQDDEETAVSRQSGSQVLAENEIHIYTIPIFVLLGRDVSLSVLRWNVMLDAVRTAYKKSIYIYSETNTGGHIYRENYTETYTIVEKIVSFLSVSS